MDPCLGTYLEGRERWTVGPLPGTDSGPGEALRITEVLQDVLQVFCMIPWLLGCQLASCCSAGSLMHGAPSSPFLGPELLHADQDNAPAH